MSKSNYYLISIVSLVLATIAYLLHIKGLMVFLLMSFWLFSFSYSLKNIDKRITLLSFLFTFFTFLLSRLFIDTLIPSFSSSYIEDASKSLTYNRDTETFVLFSLILALVGLSWGYLSSEKRTNIKPIIQNPVYLNKIRLIAKRFTIFFFIFNFLVAIEQIKYVWANGYMDYYLAYSETLPHICYTFAAAYKFAFFIFLATMPSKSEAKPIILLYVFVACVSLLTGQRGAFITPVLFILIYLFMRNSISPDSIWIGKKGKLAILISLPLLCAAMFVVMLIRGQNDAGNENLFTLVVNLFYQLGGSEKIIGFAYDLQSKIPDNQWYSLGPLIRFLQDNPISYILGFGHSIENQSIEMATKGHELGSFLTYNLDQYRYLAGGNLASSYVAELWLDFGFIGIILGSYIYGRILGSVSSLLYSNVWISTVLLIMINRILTAPRASFMFFLTDCLSVSFLIMVIYILVRCKGISRYIYNN